MSLLREFQEITQQVAEAISAALQIETEIVDDTMTIIAGTGKYKDRINTKEEGGEVNAGYLYGRVLTTNQPFFIEDARSDPPTIRPSCRGSPKSWRSCARRSITKAR